MVKLYSLFLLCSLGIFLSHAQEDEYLSKLPPSVYEVSEITPQTMDYNPDTKIFLAHSAYYENKLIHYYKFRIYSDENYPTVIDFNEPPKFLFSPFYLFTSTEGDFSSIIEDQLPIVRNITSDGQTYSDFAQIHWVVVKEEYNANDAKSYRDLVRLQESGAVNITESQIFANIPVVPLGSTLQDPIDKQAEAPIKPLRVWYRGVQAQVFIFESTSRGFADYFNPITREGSASDIDSGYEISVSPFVNDDGILQYSPMWHLNQYIYGVTPGENNGGPWDQGMRNIIDLDRKEEGYSPLKRLEWISKLPVNYAADEASSSEVLTIENGFNIETTAIYINCPSVGSYGGTDLNDNAATTFGPKGSPFEYVFQGALQLERDIKIDLFTGVDPLASNTTNALGGYMIVVDADELSRAERIFTRRTGESSNLATFSLTTSQVRFDDSASHLLITSVKLILFSSLLALFLGFLY